MHKFGLTDEEINHAAGLLSKLEAGFLPQQLFNEINRLHVTSTLVIVPLRFSANGLEVLMTQRDADDPVWPEYWHLPGTMLRPNDKAGDYTDAFRRILKDELQNVSISSEPTFFKLAFTETLRGRESTQIYAVEVTGKPTQGKFFPVNQLPVPRIDHETTYIQEVAAQFKNKLLGRGL